jgi:hypothetical protein
VLVAALALAVLVLIGLLVIALPGGGTPAPTEAVAGSEGLSAAATPAQTATAPVAATATPTPEESVEQPVAVEDPGTSACGLQDGPDVLPVTPPDTEWELYGTVASPTSPAIGPGRRQDDVWSCFAPTAEGAVFAATNAMIQIDEHEDPTLVVQGRFAESPGKQVLLDIFAETEDSDEPNNGVFVAGFNVLRYTDEVDAVVDLLFSAPGGVASATVALVWVDGDWFVDVPLDGEWVEVEAVPSAAGYVPWSP